MRGNRRTPDARLPRGRLTAGPFIRPSLRSREAHHTVEQTGRHDEAVREYEQAAALSPDFDYVVAAMAHAYGAKGDRTHWQQHVSRLIELRRSRYVSGFQLATAYVGAGEIDTAIGWLQTAVTERDAHAPFIAIDPVFRPLHGDPRFQRIVESTRTSR